MFGYSDPLFGGGPGPGAVLLSPLNLRLSLILSRHFVVHSQIAEGGPATSCGQGLTPAPSLEGSTDHFGWPLCAGPASALFQSGPCVHGDRSAGMGHQGHRQETLRLSVDGHRLDPWGGSALCPGRMSAALELSADLLFLICECQVSLYAFAGFGFSAQVIPTGLT